MGDPPSSRSVDIQTLVHQTMQQFQESREKRLDEGPDQSACMESAESPRIKIRDASISKISKACGREEMENEDVFSLSNNSRSEKSGAVGPGPLVDYVGSLEADGPRKTNKLMELNLSEVPIIEDVSRRWKRRTRVLLLIQAQFCV